MRDGLQACRAWPSGRREVEVDEALARTLISEQFPGLDSSRLRLVGAGWDNTVWATADGVAFRFPRREIAIAGVRREMAILPELAPCLPVAIPDAQYASDPNAAFRWPWFGSRLIPGREIALAQLDDRQRVALAPALGSFLRCLHSLTLASTAALPVDPMGRTDMALRVPRTRAAFANLAPRRGLGEGASDVLAQAERLPAADDVVLVHGDLHVRHVLVDEHGALAGVIDWGDVCRADRSADLSLYWSLFGPAGRAAFLSAYGPIGSDGLLRARVIALFLCATLATYARAEEMPELEHEAIRGLERTLVN